jgi:hypothetical protein
MSSQRIRSRKSVGPVVVLAAVAILGCLAAAAIACGPFFPNNVLDSRDETVLSAPVADFCSEIDRLMPAGFKPKPPAAEKWVRPYTDDAVAKAPAEETAAADAADLKKALADLKTPQAQADALLKKDAVFRAAVADMLKAGAAEWDPQKRTLVVSAKAKAIAVPQGLPPEFEHYLRGAAAFHQGKRPEAIKEWQAVLDLPQGQRRYRTLWATFMIGRTLVDSDPKSAEEHLRKVPELVKAGYPDSLDLAAASRGWIARAELNQDHYRQAVDLYLAEYHDGVRLAGMSLRDTAARAFKQGPGTLKGLAADPVVRPVMTAYVVSRGGWWGDWPKDNVYAKQWLQAIEAADVRDAPGADRLAWAAYQSADWDCAARWLARAPADSPVAQWVRAKLLLRDGKVDEAARILAGLVKELPAAKDPLLCTSEYDNYEGPVVNQKPVRNVAGELAVLRMNRRQYSEALDLLIRFDYWFDAAYVAERVLTDDELIAYVDKHWSAELAAQWKTQGDDENRQSDEKYWQPRRALKIRDLLARRLVREGRWKDARPYFTADVQKKLDSYIQGIRDGADKKLSNEKRAAALVTAARLARYSGLDLLGTELDPDYAIHGGMFGASAEEEQKPPEPPRPATDKIAPRSAEEKKRAEEPVASPDRRFHYRYVAADHAWAALQLMPDNTDETARFCCEAGGWLKNRDPKAADRFYKLLVKKCPKTDIGREAERLHWFPPNVGEPAATATTP